MDRDDDAADDPAASDCSGVSLNASEAEEYDVTHSLLEAAGPLGHAESYCV